MLCGGVIYTLANRVIVIASKFKFVIFSVANLRILLMIFVR
jgi:hypothetical protein